MSMIQYIHVANLKRFCWELNRKHDLIRNFNIFPGHIFVSKNSDKIQNKSCKWGQHNSAVYIMNQGTNEIYEVNKSLKLGVIL